jgi:hypothetical protein
MIEMVSELDAATRAYTEGEGRLSGRLSPTLLPILSLPKAATSPVSLPGGQEFKLELKLK